MRLVLAALLAWPLAAQTICPPTPIYSRCELVFELTAEDRTAHPNPYVSVDLRAEFRSPRHRTMLIHAFQDGGSRMVIRFAPTEPGDWEYRLTSNLKQFDNKLGKVTATAAETPGFIRPANGHHWIYTESRKAHLWMGDTVYPLAWLEPELFTRIVDARAEQRFTHIRGYGIGRDEYRGKTFVTPDQPDPEFYRILDERIAYLNSKGIVFDMILGHDRNHLAELFPSWQQRERYVRYMVSRYAPFNVTWQIVQEFEEYENGRELAKEVGGLLKKLDPYQHPRSTHTVATSAPLAADGWMEYIVYQSSDDQLGAIEHQLYGMPFVNAEFAYEDSGAGRTHAHHVDSDTFRRRLWDAFMNGQYPTFGNTGTYGGQRLRVDAKYLESPGARFMTIWFDLVATTRYWELEPYFDLDGGRAMALPGTEYIVYIEKPSGPVEVRVEKHNYDVKWVNPQTGEAIPAKNFNAARYAFEPPDNKQDWVLHISREGRKEGMLRSYKFESRPFLMQEIESDRKSVPYEIAAPAKDEFSVSAPPPYEAKLTRQTRGTRSMMYLWTGEVGADGLGYRVLGTGAQGTLRITQGIAKNYPATLNLRLHGMNANGKVYVVDRIYRLTQ